MKKIIGIFLAGVVVVSGIVLVYKITQTKIAPESVLPQNPIVYICVSDVEKSVKKFSSTKLWRNISKINVDLLLEKSGVDATTREQYRKVSDEFQRVTSSLFLEKFFGQEIAFALYKPKQAFSAFLAAEKISEDLYSFALVSRLKPDAQVLEFIGKIYSAFSQTVQTRQEKYKDYEIVIVQVGAGMNVYYVKIKDLLVVSLSSQMIRSCIDTATHSAAALSTDKEYRLSRGQLPKTAQIVSFINFQNLLDIILEGFDLGRQAGGDFGPKNLEERLEMIEGFKTATSVFVAGDISKTLGIVRYDRGKINPKYVTIFSRKPEKNETIYFVPKSVIGYHWSNTFDFEELWKSFLDGFKEGASQQQTQVSPDAFIKAFEDSFGFSIENDLIRSLGNECGGYLSDINLQGPFPIPDLLLFVQIKDKAKIPNLIAGLLQKNGLQLQEENYKGTTLHYISLPFGEGLQPGYCVLKDYFLISVNRKILQDTVDALQNKSQALSENRDFQEVVPGFSTESNSLFFLKTDLLVRRLRGLCEWGIGWFSLLSAQQPGDFGSAEQEVTDLENTFVEKQEFLASLNVRQTAAQQELKDLQGQGVDISEKQKELEDIAVGVSEAQEALENVKLELEKKQEEREMARLKYERQKEMPGLVKLYLDEAVYPIFDGLLAQKAFGGRGVIYADRVESFSHVKTQE